MFVGGTLVLFTLFVFVGGVLALFTLFVFVGIALVLFKLFVFVGGTLFLNKPLGGSKQSCAVEAILDFQSSQRSHFA